MKTREAIMAWNYMRFGKAGNYVSNSDNGKEIVRTSNNLDTLWFECNCYENNKYVGKAHGMEAVDWLLK